MNDNWSKLQSKTIDVSKTNKLDRKYNHLKKVISDPDKYNTKIATKDDILSLQQQVDELNLTVIALQEDIEYLSLNLSKLENPSSSDDDYVTPEDIDLFPGP